MRSTGNLSSSYKSSSGYYSPCSCSLPIHTRSDSRLFNLARLGAKQTAKTLVMGMSFADDAAVTTHNEQHVQCLMNRIYLALNISDIPSAWSMTTDVSRMR